MFLKNLIVLDEINFTLLKIRNPKRSQVHDNILTYILTIIINYIRLALNKQAPILIHTFLS